MADEFEYQAVPKFIDFQNENEDFELSAFFKGDNLIQPSPHPLRNGEKATTGAPAIKSSSSTPLKSRSVRATNGEKATTGAPAAPIKASSNLALFNHGASRIAEKARRRSQQIQAPPENPPKGRNRAVPFTQILRSYKPPTGTTPSKPLTKPNPFPLRRSTSRCRDTQADMDPRIRASVDRLSTPLKSRSVRATNGEKATTNAPAHPIRASSNLALFNHGASRIAEKARRRSQQIHAPPENPPTGRNCAVPFTQILRSYKAPTGTNPSKPLTKPNPFPLRRSTSRCRDTQADIDPRIRASVDRLSAPLKSKSVRATNGEKATTGAPAAPLKGSSYTRASVDRLSTPRIRAPVDRSSVLGKRENLRSMK
jgi:hypothetical protein